MERELAVARAALLLSLVASLATALHDASPPPSPSRCARACTGAAGLLFGERLDLNRASAESLEVLPGIGPARSRAIVRERTRRRFRRVEDLERVRGIGPRTVEGLAGWVDVAAPPPDG